MSPVETRALSKLNGLYYARTNEQRKKEMRNYLLIIYRFCRISAHYSIQYILLCTRINNHLKKQPGMFQSSRINLSVYTSVVFGWSLCPLSRIFCGWVGTLLCFSAIIVIVSCYTFPCVHGVVTSFCLPLCAGSNVLSGPNVRIFLAVYLVVP